MQQEGAAMSESKQEAIARLPEVTSTELPPMANIIKAHRERLDDKKLFQKMSSADFVFMWMFAWHTKNTGADRMYLTEVAQRLKLPMHTVTKIVKELKAKGLVQWKFDGTGEDGTYILLTEDSLADTMEQATILRTFYQRVIEQYGEEEFIALLGQVAKLEELITREIDKLEVEPDA
jgi:DNA-binding MarR family transcriptional regulator